MKLNYCDYRQKRQEEFNLLPVFFAFSNEQLKAGLEAKGLTINDLDKISSIGAGGFILKTDLPLLRAYLNKSGELQELMKDYDFAYSAFLYEMNNHEYCINMQADWDVCSCFGYVEYTESPDELTQYFDELKFEPQTRRAYINARTKHLDEAIKNGWY